ncbi:MAG: hypothetical protein HZC28_06125 [Spirochaetes bacterium]|nr:hypothetical protein [Spirochaetota bacterium]
MFFRIICVYALIIIASAMPKSGNVLLEENFDGYAAGKVWPGSVSGSASIMVDAELYVSSPNALKVTDAPDTKDGWQPKFGFTLPARPGEHIRLAFDFRFDSGSGENFTIDIMQAKGEQRRARVRITDTRIYTASSGKEFGSQIAGETQISKGKWHHIEILVPAFGSSKITNISIIADGRQYYDRPVWSGTSGDVIDSIAMYAEGKVSNVTYIDNVRIETAADEAFIRPAAAVRPAFSGEIAVDCGIPGEKITPSYLGAHITDNMLPEERNVFAARRFSSHGLYGGALIRHFVVSKLKEKKTLSDGRAVEFGNRTWWGGIQANDAERGAAETAPYRYRATDFWQMLDITEQFGCKSLVVTPGFPMQTKETAMAAVAFCNADPSDTRVIGVDKWGEDWKTAGYWASIRAKGDDRHAAHPKPYQVRYWELGNEFYYPVADSIPKGNWMTISNYDNYDASRNNTVRARYYLNGRDIDGEHFDGYLAYYEAMKSIDPSIRIAPMLAPESKARWYVDWNEVLLTGAKGKMDFVSYHGYAHSGSLTPEGIVAQPQMEGRSIIDAIKKHMAERSVDLPLINSEWHPYEPIKTGSIQMMASLATADSIGMFLTMGVRGQCFYGPYDTKHGNDGSWATLVRAVESNAWKRPAAFRWPSYYAFYLWTGAADHLLSVTCDGDVTNDIAVYAMKRKAGGVQIIAVSKRPEKRSVTLALKGITAKSAVIDEVYPANGKLTDEDVILNGKEMSSSEMQSVDDLSSIPSAARVSLTGSSFRYELKGYSITRFIAE